MGRFTTQVLEAINIFFNFRNSVNHCWKKDSFLKTHEDFQFLNEKKLFSDSEEKLATNVENMVKSEGFLADKEFQIFSNVTMECVGNKWVFSNQELSL